jgi:hypothetical protein
MSKTRKWKAKRDPSRTFDAKRGRFAYLGALRSTFALQLRFAYHRNLSFIPSQSRGRAATAGLHEECDEECAFSAFLIAFLGKYP